MTLISRGQAALNRRMQQSAGVSVVYARGAEQVALTAWVGRTVFSRSPSEPGPAVVFGERDYFVAVTDLVIGGSYTAPQKGDRITETIDGADLVFEVVPPSIDEPAWRYSDQTRTAYRLHTKRVA